MQYIGQSLEQGLAKWSPQAKSNPQPNFVNKVLLEHSHTSNRIEGSIKLNVGFSKRPEQLTSLYKIIQRGELTSIRTTTIDAADIKKIREYFEKPYANKI